MAQALNAVAPQMTFGQKTKTIVELKKQDNNLGGQIEQNGKDMNLELFLRRGLDEEQAKAAGKRFIRLVKKNSADETPTSSADTLGRGRFNYSLTIRNPVGKVLFSGLKPAKNKDVLWADETLQSSVEQKDESENEKERDEAATKTNADQNTDSKESSTTTRSLQERLKAHPTTDPLDIVDFPDKYR